MLYIIYNIYLECNYFDLAEVESRIVVTRGSGEWRWKVKFDKYVLSPM